MRARKILSGIAIAVLVLALMAILSVRRLRPTFIPSTECVAFSNNGEWVAYSSYPLRRNTVFVCDGRTGAVLKRLDGPESISDLVFSSDDSILVAGCGSAIATWSTETWEPLATIHTSEWVRAIAILPKNNVLAVAHDRAPGEISCYDTRTGAALEGLPVSIPGKIITGLAACDDGVLAIAVGDDLLLYQIAEKKMKRRLGVDVGEFADRIKLSSNGRILAVASRREKKVSCWSIMNRKIPELLVDFEVPLVTGSIALSPDGKYLVVGSYRSGMKPAHAILYEVQSGRRIFDETIESAKMAAVAISPDNSLFSLGELKEDGCIRLLQIPP